MSLSRSKKDFKFNHHLGEGSYSSVIHCTEIDTANSFAAKIVSKKLILKENKVKYVMREKSLLNRLSHCGIIKLYATFQDSLNLYYILELAKTDLNYFSKRHEISGQLARFYTAEIATALEFLHENGVIHRDLKPENCLLDFSLHIKLGDFGTAKDLLEQSDATAERKDSFVGTAQYCPPVTPASDVWSLGCILYLLTCKKFAFNGPTDYITFQRIQKCEYSFPDDFDQECKSLVEKILVLDPSTRPTIADLKKDAYFKGLEFGIGLWNTTPPAAVEISGQEEEIVQSNSDVEFGMHIPNTRIQHQGNRGEACKYFCRRCVMNKLSN